MCPNDWSLGVTGNETHLLPKTIFTSRLIWYNSSVCYKLKKNSYLKKYHELVYEKCQIVLILLQLNSCSFNLVNPGKDPGFIRFLPGPGPGPELGPLQGLGKMAKVCRGQDRGRGPGWSISLSTAVATNSNVKCFDTSGWIKAGDLRVCIYLSFIFIIYQLCRGVCPII